MSESDSKLSEPVVIQYQFTLSKGKTRRFRVELNRLSLDLIQKEQKQFPEWTKLSRCQCPGCPLKEETTPRCPVAVSLTGVIDFFRQEVSYEEADVEITTESRKYLKRAPLQYGLSSLMGIYMVTSGCPILNKLRPMVKTHLPFATMEETLYRVISMYLLAQYFIAKKGGAPDWEMKNLASIYQEIDNVNESFWKRISGIQVQDANLNAVIHLDCFARYANYFLLEKGLDNMSKLFNAYLASTAQDSQ